MNQREIAKSLNVSQVAVAVSLVLRNPPEMQIIEIGNFVTF